MRFGCGMSPCSAAASKPCALQRAVQDVDVALAVAEDERVLDVLGADQAAQRLALVLALGHDRQRLRSTVAAGEAGGATAISFGFIRNASARRRISGGMVAEKNSVWRIFGSSADDALDIGDEAHVEHAVGLVDDQDLDVGQQDLAALEQIEQAARRGDQHVDAAVELALLVGEAFAADQQRHGQLVVLAVELEALGDLGRQLARRLEDQRARHARPGAAGGQDVDHRQGEARRLAGAGLGAAEHVAPGEDDRDGLLLDRCRCCITRVDNGAQDVGTQTKI